MAATANNLSGSRACARPAWDTARIFALFSRFVLSIFFAEAALVNPLLLKGCSLLALVP
jgi:hypothetical protein